MKRIGCGYFKFHMYFIDILRVLRKMLLFVIHLIPCYKIITSVSIDTLSLTVNKRSYIANALKSNIIAFNVCNNYFTKKTNVDFRDKIQSILRVCTGSGFFSIFLLKNSP